jgi:hypothetical protein
VEMINCTIECSFRGSRWNLESNGHHEVLIHEVKEFPMYFSHGTGTERIKPIYSTPLSPDPISDRMNKWYDGNEAAKYSSDIVEFNIKVRHDRNLLLYVRYDNISSWKPRFIVPVGFDELKLKYALSHESGKLPDDLQRDFKLIFGCEVPPMNGNQARTLQMRIEYIKELIYKKLYHNQNLNYCPCGCDYVAGCGTP